MKWSGPVDQVSFFCLVSPREKNKRNQPAKPGQPLHIIRSLAFQAYPFFIKLMLKCTSVNWTLMIEEMTKWKLGLMVILTILKFEHYVLYKLDLHNLLNLFK